MFAIECEEGTFVVRFFVEEQQVEDCLVNITGSDARHIGKVLRQRPGDFLTIVWCQQAWQSQIEIVSEDAIIARLLEPLAETKEPPLQVYLLQGIAKGERMDMVMQKSVELGVGAIIPVHTRYTVVELSAKKAVARQERWQKIAESAAKQCGRLAIPQVYPVLPLEEALAAVPSDCRLIMPWEKTDDCSFAQILKEPAPAKAGLIIGPEGGLAPEEALLAQEKGASLVSLGKRILRTETAAITALSILMYQWGDVGSD